MEAECVAYVISNYFGIGQLNCVNYLTLYNITGKDIIQSISRIVACAEQVILGIDNLSI